MPLAKTKFSSLLPAYLVIFIGFVGYSLMITVFTPMFMYGHNGILPDVTLNTRIIVLGIVLCLYPLGQFFGSPVLGALSDHYGRKPILMISLGVTTVCYFFIAFSLSIQSLTLLIISSLLAGLAEANIVIAQSAIADVTTPVDRTRFFGYIYLSASSAYIIGPLIGGKLADPQIVHWFDYSTPFWVVFVLLIFTSMWTYTFFRETKSLSSTSEPIHYFDAFTNLFSIFTDKRIRVLYWLNFLLYFAIFGFFRCYPMYLVDEFHMNVSKESEFIAWVAVPIILANLWLTAFIARFLPVKITTFYSALFTGIFMFLIIVPNSENALWITLFLTGLALALCLPACATFLSISVNEREQGSVMGNNQSLQVGAEALSGLIGGLLAAIMVKLSLIVLAFIAIGTAIFFFFYFIKN